MTKWKGIFLVRAKSGATNSRKLFVWALVIPTALLVEHLRTGKGGNYVGGVLQDCCRRVSMKHELASNNMSQQNAACERDGNALYEMIRCFLSDSRLLNVCGERGSANRGMPGEQGTRCSA